MLIADTHVHIYPAYDAAAFFDRAYINLSRHPDAPACSLGLFLTERRDCHVFEAMAKGQAIPPGYRLDELNEPGTVVLTKKNTEQQIFLFAGRQYVTSEGVEVLSLASLSIVEEYKPADETIQAIRDTGGIPVLSWAPGKWSGQRGRTVRNIIEGTKDEPLLLGDTSMRPIGFPEPALFRLARSKGIPITAGTDPLPFAGDQRIVGRYGIRSDTFDVNKPVTSARVLLKHGAFSICGKRSALPVSMKRWVCNRMTKAS